LRARTRPGMDIGRGCEKCRICLDLDRTFVSLI
jgi:hypothetical protein